MKKPVYVSKEALKNFIKNALEEDIQDGDHSTLATIPKDLQQQAKLLVKQDCILAGVELAEIIFKQFDKNLKVERLLKDGDAAKVGDIAFFVTGSARSILSTERFVLNCMQRMSGIATLTHDWDARLLGTKTKLLDTRKTTPNFRLCEKWAVAIGGGTNHRFGLYDMIMLKDNHNDFAGGISKAIQKTQLFLQENNLDLKIIVEARNLDEIKEILQNKGVHRILIDNFNFEDTNTAVALIGDTCQTESSGNINENTIRDYAICGVDYISSGALTHSVYNMDLSLKAL